MGVELFGKLECSDEHPCTGLDKHAHFKDFGMAFLTLFRIATGDNWNGIMKVKSVDRSEPEFYRMFLFSTEHSGRSTTRRITAQRQKSFHDGDRSDLFCHFCADGSIRSRQCCCRCSHEETRCNFNSSNQTKPKDFLFFQESNRMMADDAEIDEEIERQLEADARERDFLENPPLDEKDLEVKRNFPLDSTEPSTCRIKRKLFFSSTTNNRSDSSR